MKTLSVFYDINVEMNEPENCDINTMGSRKKIDMKNEFLTAFQFE